MTHAWLIIAHNEFDILRRLVSALDDERSDIFIHFDKKVKNLPEIRTSKSHLIILDNRIDVRWGAVSQIECELALFQAAVQQGSYDYYHIVSGVTLPLKRFDEIDAFFQTTAGKSVFTGLCKDTPYQETLKMRRYNLFLRNYTSGKRLLRIASQLGWKSAIALQRLLHIETNRGQLFYKASNWLSLTDEAVRFILQRKQEILKRYRWSFCGDEYFVPSELMASPMKDYVLNSDRYLYREIVRSTATTYHLEDLQKLSATGSLFARKFTYS
ncbi:MAG: glycosyl transferase [Bacteroidales bacterium]|nr:glycosyl transferase [Bacteroidales bacterium]